MSDPGSLPGPVVCIVGPTASGKSAVADEVALALGSAVVSVDAMQVYRGMDIGTAKTPVGQRRVPLEMVDVVDPGQDYSVALFQEQARAVTNRLLEHGLTPVLCGGTGLYFNAVIDEMSFPAGKHGDEPRGKYAQIARTRGPQALWDLLRERDAPSAELIHPNNAKRVVRALEMLDEGTSYAVHHRGLHARLPHYDVRVWGLTMGRERLYGRIDCRVDMMMEQGLLDEVRDLKGRGLTLDTTAGQAIGYKELLEHLDGASTLGEATELVKRRTRRYAKRQLSWFRHDGRVAWLDMDEMDTREAAATIVASLHAESAEGRH